MTVMLSGVTVMLIGLAAVARPAPGPGLSGEIWADRARVVGLEPSTSTGLWLRAVQRFGAAALSQDPSRFSDIGPKLQQDLHGATELDPSFDDPWLGGTLMLRIAGGEAPLVAAGRERRPDLPWHLLAAGPVP